MIKRIDNPPNPYSSSMLEWIDAAPEAALEVYEERAKSIVATNDSPDIGFSHSINPYRGCFHACAYCYARPTHQYIDFGAGSDFERKIVVKVNAVEKLRETFMKRSWQGDLLMFSGVTDCYQPLEASYELTRGCLEVCDEFSNPVSLITKGALVRRDIDILQSLSGKTDLTVNMSLAFSDDKMSKAIEPGAPRPSTRLRALAELSAAGIETGIGIAPVIPGLNDSQIPEILKRAADAGAKTAFIVLLRLPAEVRDVFASRLESEFPGRYNKVLNFVKAMREGELYRPQWGKRMKGSGPQWDAIKFMFQSSCEKYGLNKARQPRPFEEKATFKRPEKQLGLFESPNGR